jgi:hypothetical protein
VLRIDGTATSSDRQKYNVYGRGVLIGNDQTGLARIEIVGSGGDERGFVQYFLRWNNPAKINGYWIAKDRTQFGDYAFGALHLKRSSETRTS